LTFGGPLTHAGSNSPAISRGSGSHAFGNNMKREHSDLASRFGVGPAIAKDARQRRNFGDPASVVLTFGLNSKHGARTATGRLAGNVVHAPPPFSALANLGISLLPGRGTGAILKKEHHQTGKESCTPPFRPLMAS
jgi:hypothetical protein